MIKIKLDTSIEHSMHMITIETQTSIEHNRSKKRAPHKNNPVKAVTPVGKNDRTEQDGIKNNSSKDSNENLKLSNSNY